jgi:AraC-like DNA-binding protein
LSDPNLSVSAVADRHGLTPRYVHMLFETELLTFSEYVLEQRLDHAWHALMNPVNVGRSIGEIALGAGFGDLSYFNRTFRRRYGNTPSGVRAASGSAKVALRPAPPSTR